MLSRRAFIVSAGLAVSSLLAGCKKDDEDGESSIEAHESDDGTTLPDEEYDSAIKSGKLSYTITDCRIADSDVDGDKNLVVYYRFKNRSGKDATDVAWTVFKAYQNGIKLGGCGMTADGLSVGDAKETIESGASVTDYVFFNLKDSSPVTIKLQGKTLAKVSPGDLKPNS